LVRYAAEPSNEDSVKTVRCPKGRWTRILFSFGVALDKDWKVTFSSDNGAVTGDVTVFRTVWIIPRPAQALPLQPTMVFQRDLVNGVFSVKVNPEADVTANISG